MDRTRTIIIWIAMAAFIAMIAYFSGADWWLAILIGVLLVASIVGGATWFMYRKQKKLVDSAAKFNIDLKNGKINPADLRRMYFSGGKARTDALFIASRAMNCSVQEAERQLSAKITKQTAQQEMAKMQSQSSGKQKRWGKPR